MGEPKSLRRKNCWFWVKYKEGGKPLEEWLCVHVAAGSVLAMVSKAM